MLSGAGMRGRSVPGQLNSSAAASSAASSSTPRCAASERRCSAAQQSLEEKKIKSRGGKIREIGNNGTSLICNGWSKTAPISSSKTRSQSEAGGVREPLCALSSAGARRVAHARDTDVYRRISVCHPGFAFCGQERRLNAVHRQRRNQGKSDPFISRLVDCPARSAARRDEAAWPVAGS